MEIWAWFFIFYIPSVIFLRVVIWYGHFTVTGLSGGYMISAGYEAVGRVVVVAVLWESWCEYGI